MFPVFEMVKYHNKEYPANIALRCEEVTSHLDICEIKFDLPFYSLHTEYSYGKRNFNSSLYDKTSELVKAQKGGVPQLWKNEQWAWDFAEFIFEITKGKTSPTVIEIHPPFSDYTDSMETFVKRYKIFEQRIIEKFPDVQILIENRCGSVYQGGKFLLSDLDSFFELNKIIDRENLRLRFAFDIPQLFTAHHCENKNSSVYFQLLREIADIKENIAGVHLWGKRNSPTGRRVSHCGDLCSYFEGNDKLLDEFLESFVLLFSDGKKRKLVIEVNSGNEDLVSIINDLERVGVVFD